MKNIFINEIEKDYAGYCLEKLKEVETSYKYKSDEMCLYDYHRYKFRKIAEKPRQVIVSSSFNCPNEYRNVVKIITKKLEKGDSVISYQSRKLKDTDYDDSLLMDWGIQHLHLGDVIESDGFIKRTKELIFIRVTDDKAYMLDIFDHKQWSTLKILEIIHKDWPLSIDNFRIKNMIDISPCPDESTIIQYRKIGLNSPVELSDGTVYMGPGGGITTARTPAQATDNVLYLRKLFKGNFNHISENFDAICKTLNEKNNTEKVTIGLNLHEGKLVYTFKEMNKSIILTNTS